MNFVELFLQMQRAMLQLWSDFSSLSQPVFLNLNIFQLLAAFGLSGIIGWAVGKAAISAFINLM